MIVISKPSQIFLTVDTVVVLFRPDTMLLSVDWVIPQIYDNLLTVMPFCRHNSNMRNLTASPMFTKCPPDPIEIIYFTSFELK